jgi:hypothetical protein
MKRLIIAAAFLPLAAYAQGFTPGFDDLMTMLIQPRHIKLYEAGEAKNWELAGAEARNLRQAFDRIAVAIPAYLGNDVKTAVANLMGPPLKKLDDAIAHADAKGFASAYKEVTDGCNACHTFMERPFIVMKVPDAHAFPDQDFKPQP